MPEVPALHHHDDQSVANDAGDEKNRGKVKIERVGDDGQKRLDVTGSVDKVGVAGGVGDVCRVWAESGAAGRQVDVAVVGACFRFRDRFVANGDVWRHRRQGQPASEGLSVLEKYMADK